MIILWYSVSIRPPPTHQQARHQKDEKKELNARLFHEGEIYALKEQIEFLLHLTLPSWQAEELSRLDFSFVTQEIHHASSLLNFVFTERRTSSSCFFFFFFIHLLRSDSIWTKKKAEVVKGGFREQIDASICFFEELHDEKRLSRNWQ